VWLQHFTSVERIVHFIDIPQESSTLPTLADKDKDKEDMSALRRTEHRDSGGTLLRPDSSSPPSSSSSSTTTTPCCCFSSCSCSCSCCFSSSADVESGLGVSTRSGEEEEEEQLSPQWPEDGGTISFEDLWMRYRENTPFVLRGVSFRVDRGERVGICGRTGAGECRGRREGDAITCCIS
jgi:ABC-type multidrug transport system fused ATPase/permease subunit